MKTIEIADDIQGRGLPNGEGVIIPSGTTFEDAVNVVHRVFSDQFAAEKLRKKEAAAAVRRHADRICRDIAELDRGIQRVFATHEGSDVVHPEMGRVVHAALRRMAAPSWTPQGRDFWEQVHLEVNRATDPTQVRERPVRCGDRDVSSPLAEDRGR